MWPVPGTRDTRSWRRCEQTSPSGRLCYCRTSWAKRRWDWGGGGNSESARGPSTSLATGRQSPSGANASESQILELKKSSRNWFFPSQALMLTLCAMATRTLASSCSSVLETRELRRRALVRDTQQGQMWVGLSCSFELSRPGFESPWKHLPPQQPHELFLRLRSRPISSTILLTNHDLPRHYHVSPRHHDDAGLYRFCGDGRASTRPCKRPCTRIRHAARLTDIG